MDTVGSLIDKLNTIDFKMWTNQEILYYIRRMSLNEFITVYYSEDGMETIYMFLRKMCDLNLQRNNLVDEIDSTIIEMIEAGVSGEDLDSGKYIQRKHKTQEIKDERNSGNSISK